MDDNPSSRSDPSPATDSSSSSASTSVSADGASRGRGHKHDHPRGGATRGSHRGSGRGRHAAAASEHPVFPELDSLSLQEQATHDSAPANEPHASHSAPGARGSRGAHRGAYRGQQYRPPAPVRAPQAPRRPYRPHAPDAAASQTSAAVGSIDDHHEPHHRQDRQDDRHQHGHRGDHAGQRDRNNFQQPDRRDRQGPHDHRRPDDQRRRPDAQPNGPSHPSRDGVDESSSDDAAGSDRGYPRTDQQRGPPPRKTFNRRSGRAAEPGRYTDTDRIAGRDAAPAVVSSAAPPASSAKTLAADLAERLTNGAYECMICTDSVKRHVAVWNCGNCYAVFHYPCIKKWSQSSTDDGRAWRCPGCQNINIARPLPVCFCGKMVDPPVNSYITPHSCGEVCGKMRRGGLCPHPCSLMCHPGSCPPCSAMAAERGCFCGKTRYRLRCGEADDGHSCGAACGKALPCGNHRCAQPCHRGPCSPCAETETQTCYCGSRTEPRPCGSGDADASSEHDGMFCCEQTCNRPFTCGKHTCERVCHKGPCGDCPFAPGRVALCPCGKLPIMLLSKKPRRVCTDPIPTCPNVCAKGLSCGHTCPATCHLGPCPPCNQQVKLFCRCCATNKTVRCHEAPGLRAAGQFLCNKACKQTRSCGRHQCGNKCCPSSPQADATDAAGLHICREPCGRRLKCGKHKCELVCHPGKCPPCHEAQHEPYVCECGRTRVEPPIMCGTPLPDCPHPCVRPQPCGHEAMHSCHAREKPCPPCVILVSRPCAGGHEMRGNVPCHQTAVSCGRSCGRLLACGMHHCKRSCHGDACQPRLESGKPVVSGVGPIPPSSDLSCGQPCGLTRAGCGHPCQAACHPDQPCPRTPCKVTVHLRCACGRRQADGPCNYESGDGLLPVPPQPPRQLPCDELCEQEQRNRRLASALGIDGTTRPVYSALLLALGRSSPLFIHKIEKTFDEFIRGTGAKFSFPPMDRIQRQIVHELGEVYGLETQSYDPEPYRSVTVTRRKDTRTPSLLLSTVLADPSKNTVAGASFAPTLPQPGVWSPASAHPPVPPPAATDAPPIAAASSSRQTIYTLHIRDLDPGLARALGTFLHPFEGHFDLGWLDDSNVLLMFRDREQMRTAQTVLSDGPFLVSEYRDSSAASSGGGSVASSAPSSQPSELGPAVFQPVETRSRSATERSSAAPAPGRKPGTVSASDASWRKDNNFFAALTAGGTGSSGNSSGAGGGKARPSSDTAWGDDDEFFAPKTAWRLPSASAPIAPRPQQQPARASTISPAMTVEGSSPSPAATPAAAGAAAKTLAVSTGSDVVDDWEQREDDDDTSGSM